MTFIEKFDELKKKYGKVSEKKLTESFAVQIEMTDEDCGGIFYVAYVGGVFAVEPYDYHDNTASIKASSALLEDILSCKTDAAEAFLGGKLEVTGELSHALMLVELMKKAPRKKCAKKTCAQTADAADEKKAEKAKVAQTQEEVKPAEKTAKTAKKSEKKPAAKKAAK